MLPSNVCGDAREQKRIRQREKPPASLPCSPNSGVHSRRKMSDMRTQSAMKKQIEKTLQCWIGQSFWGSGRVANLLTFQFGPRQERISRYGISYKMVTYALHVQCAWRLTKAQRI